MEKVESHKKRQFDDEAQTLRFAADFGQSLKSGDIVLLHGDLGAGKTAFCRALIRGLTNNHDLIVPSPTFTLVQTYDSPKMDIWHFDLYRLSDPDEIFELGWEEALSGPLVLVEWPERLGSHTPSNAINLFIAPGDKGPESRVINIQNN